MERVSLLLAAFCLALSSGYLSGRMAALPEIAIAEAPDIRPLVPTIHIAGVRNGLLHGEVHGNARMIIDNQVFTQSGTFALDAGLLLKNEVTVSVPVWAKYVASKRGKRYYPVESSGGERIVPKNRLYFRTAQHARAAGYETSQ